MDDQDQFEAAFAEASAARAEGAVPKPAADANANAAPAEAPAEPAKPAANQAPEVAAEPSLEELRRQRDDALQRERSNAGRISAVERENNKLRATAEDLLRKLNETAAAQKPAAASDEQDVLTDAPDLEAAVRKRVAAETKGLNETVADLVQKLQSLGHATESVRQVVEPMAARDQQQTYEATWKALDEKFSPTWREDRGSPEFEQWVGSQPKAIQDLYESAVTPKDCAKVLTLFYSETGKTRGPAPPNPTPAPAGNPQQERLRLASGIAPRGSHRPAAGLAEDDFDGHFAEAAKALKRA